MHTLLTILNWVICLALCFCFAWKMRKGPGPDPNSPTAKEEKTIKESHRVQFKMGFWIMTLTFIAVGFIVQDIINNL